MAGKLSTHPSELAQAGATSGQAIVWDGTKFAPATVGGGGGSVATDAIWDVADDLAVGTGANTAARVAFAANTFPAKASTGALVAKTISDAALSVLDDATVSAMLETLGGAPTTGTGGLVRATSPAFVTPNLGVPTVLTLTNATGLPPAGVVGTAAILGANTFTARQDIAQTATDNSALVISGHSITGSGSSAMANLTGTWNTTGNPVLLRLNVTNTASGPTSLLANFAVDTVSKFSVDKAGVVTATTFIGALTGTASGNLVSGGALGTPSSGVATNLTGLPLTTGVTGLLPHGNLGTGGGGATKFLREDSTWQTIAAGASWGSITGTLSSQTDLQSALDLKATLVANTFTGQQIISTAGAASTPPLHMTGAIFTGGTATTTKPHFLIEPTGTTSTGWDTAGTIYGGNIPASYTGKWMDFHVDGVSKIYIKRNEMKFVGQVFSSGIISVDAGIAWQSGMSHDGNGNFWSVNSSGLKLANGAGVLFSDTSWFGTEDSGFRRSGARRVGLAQLANAVGLEIYGTTNSNTAPTNYTRLSLGGITDIDATTFSAHIAAQTGGTGRANGNIVLTPGGNGFLNVEGAAATTGLVARIKRTGESSLDFKFLGGTDVHIIASNSLHLNFNGTTANELIGYDSTVDTVYIRPDGAFAAALPRTESVSIGGRHAYPGPVNGGRPFYITGWSTTVIGRPLLGVYTHWVDQTDATRKARVIFNAHDTAEREAIRIEASGTAAMLGFFGTAAAVQPTAVADATDAATAISQLNLLLARVRTLGLIAT